MRLKSLQLHGFKSFADRTEVVFHDGLTAIVGPNGCGKSNISDAIRWVLGEQRASAIRGAKMEEAIFQGTSNRRPVNRGSVTMEIANADGILPVPWEEVEIGRTVYRDGGSEYRLNRSACRLRDIQELCRDTGLGANAYSVIENRMIDAILSDRADERRALFEEASGIGKYKDRRTSAARRLERAEVDLQRLEDLVGEVRSKVRSLARQKGRAERHRELTTRRLDVEVSLAREELAGLDSRLAGIGELLDGGLDSGQSLQTGIQAAEARIETLRARRVAAGTARTESARELEEIRKGIVTWERDLAVAEERAAHAERRLGQLASERAELAERARTASEEAARLEDEEAGLATELESVQASEEAVRTRAEAARSELSAARERLEEAEGREREIARRMARLDGDAAAAEEQADELEARTRVLAAEMEASGEALGELDDQGDLFSGRLRELESAVAVAASGVEGARADLAAAKDAAAGARAAERSAADRAGTIEARVAALDRLDRDREGMDPVVQAALAADLAGVHGALSDFIEAEPEVSRAVEAWLGLRAHALVVEDRAAAERVREWFGSSWTQGGGLVLLPLDRVPPASGAAAEGHAPGRNLVLDHVQASGAGEPWVRASLRGLGLGEDSDRPTPTDGPDGDRPAGGWVSPDGLWVDDGVVLRVGNPLGRSGVVERRAELKALRKDAREAGRDAAEAMERRTAADRSIEEAEEALEGARRAHRTAEDAHREARSEAARQTERRERLEREAEDLARQLDHASTGAVRARERSAEARRERDSLAAEEEELRARRDVARASVLTVQEEWESVRSEESSISVRKTRLTSRLERTRERMVDLRQTAASAGKRRTALDVEERELREEVEAAAATRRTGSKSLEELFGRRDEARQQLEEREAALLGLDDQLETAEKGLREARSTERKVTDRRHELQLEARELEGKRGRIEERLEGEWGQPLDELLADAGTVEGSPGELRDELDEIRETLRRLGAVNMLAVEEHEEESARLAFLEEQQEDLVSARDDLRAAIREINRTANTLFQETFEAVRENFRATFQRLFQGGECDLWLVDPDDPLESPIEIKASPGGKRTQRIDLLSGGERALTALSLLFGIYLVKPSPFCVLDEVDAPLDESNIGRFIHLLQEFKEETQFVVITHNPRTIEAADWIYGVTMEEPGVSRIVGVRLEEALEAAGAVL